MDRGAPYSAGSRGSVRQRVTAAQTDSTMEGLPSESSQDSSRNASVTDHSSLNATESAPRICPDTDTNVYLAFSFNLFSVLFLFPLSVFIFFISRRRRSLSHSDVFTLHLGLLEMLSVFAVSVLSYGIYVNIEPFTEAGLILIFVSSSGHILLQNLVCTERYLAVVHPVVYMRLKNEAGRRIRNASIGCTWVMSLLWIVSTYFTFPNIPRLPFLIQTITSLLLITFCCLSVLNVLHRPGPGGNTVHVDKTKRRAFHKLLAVTVVLLLYVLGIISCCALDVAFTMRLDTCMLVYASMWFSVPSRYALPLFFLQKIGKLRCFK